jgi:dihydrofolate reductase
MRERGHTARPAARSVPTLGPHITRIPMARLRVHGFTVSIDGYGAGPRQDLEHPLGVGGQRLHEWLIGTRTFRQMFGGEGGSAGVDDAFAAHGVDGIGAWILGRNMFGPIRGPWPDDTWRGWWGDEPPYHTPVFVLTSHPRASFEMKGGTTFHFVTGGVHAALDEAMKAAGGQDVRIGGGVATIRQYLQAGLVDEMHLAISPILLGSGEHLMSGLDLRALGYACTEHAASDKAMHVIVTRRK